MAIVFVVADIDSTVLWNPGHLVDEFGRNITVQLRNAIRAEAPVNRRANTGHGAPGNLKRNIFANKSRTGAKRLFIKVTGPEYGFYVNNGIGAITASSKRGMFLPPNVVDGHSYDGKKGVQIVSGQAANPFIDRGYAVAAAQHPCLR